MTNNDLFGNPITEQPIVKNKPTTPKVNPMLRPFGETIGEKCKNCVYLYSKQYSKKYWKCALRNNSSGPATDHRVNWPACGKFKLPMMVQVKCVCGESTVIAENKSFVKCAGCEKCLKYFHSTTERTKVTYVGNMHQYPQGQIGIVKTRKDARSGWVVYNCANDWDNYENYGGVLTEFKDLLLGWQGRDFEIIKNK